MIPRFIKQQTEKRNENQKRKMAYHKISKTLSLWYTYSAPKKLKKIKSKINNSNPNKKNMPTLVFIHGWVHNHTVWKKIERVFQAKGYKTLCIDLPGHGKSSVPFSQKEYSIKSMAAACVHVLKHKKIINPVIIGHSLGSMVAQYMYQKIKPQAMILIGSSYITPMRDAMTETMHEIYYLDQLTQLINTGVSAKKELNLIDFSKSPSESDVIMWMRGASATSAKGLISCFESILRFDSRKLIRNIKCPVLLIVGEKDTRTPPKRIRLMKKLLPNAKLVIVPNQGHNVNLTAPNQTAKIILDFLKKQQKNNRGWLSYLV